MLQDLWWKVLSSKFTWSNPGATKQLTENCFSFQPGTAAVSLFFNSRDTTSSKLSKIELIYKVKKV